MSRRANRWIARIALLAAATLLPLALVEVGLRVFDPGHYAEFEAREEFSARILERRTSTVHLGPSITKERSMLRLKPNVDTTFLGKRVVTDARGMRTPPFELPKPKGVYRILVVGDSVPFGWGVAEEESFPRLLEKKLNTIGNRRYEVVNGGSPGWGLDDEWQWLQEEGLDLQPDMVVHCVIANDIEAVTPPPPLLLSPDLRRLWVLRFLENLCVRVAGAQVPDPNTAINDDQLCVGLDLMWHTCAVRQARFVFLDTIAHEKAILHAKAKNYPRLDVFLSQSWVNRHQVGATDFHPNAAGHEHIAETAFLQLRTLLLSM